MDGLPGARRPSRRVTLGGVHAPCGAKLLRLIAWRSLLLVTGFVDLDRGRAARGDARERGYLRLARREPESGRRRLRRQCSAHHQCSARHQCSSVINAPPVINTPPIVNAPPIARGNPHPEARVHSSQKHAFYSLHLHGGLFEPIDVNATSPTLGIRFGRQLGSHLQGGLLAGWTFRRKDLEQPVRRIPGPEASPRCSRASTDICCPRWGSFR